jgi:YidC/Oxa1 family membrane protein insertase
VLNPIYDFVARAVVDIHSVLVHIVGTNGWSWALSIILLVMAVRLVLFPLFVKQIKSQRQMQIMQPKIKAIKEKYKNDKQKQNEEMIKLQREHGNPLLGCLPVLVQIPLFFSIFRVMNGFAPKTGKLSPAQTAQAITTPDGRLYYPTHLNGLSPHTAYQIANAKIFGASLASSLTSSKKALELMASSANATKILCVVLIIVMMGSTYITQRQIIGRNGPATDPQAAMTQKLLLYVSPLFLGIFGFRFSIGVLLYWFTTNFWSMGQQFFVIRRMPPVIAADASGAVATPPPAVGTGRRPRPSRRPPAAPAAPPPPQRLVQQRAVPDGPDSRTGPSGGTRPPQRRKKGGRRGGRR